MEQHRTSRIWELDALRGVCILGMVLVHAAINANVLLQLGWHYPLSFELIRVGGAVIFILLSGVCTTLGHHAVKRGLLVFACGMLFTLVTVGAYWLHFAQREFLILFGILHLLGVCMLLSVPLSRLWDGTLAAIGLVVLGLGYWFMTIRIQAVWLFPLGLADPNYVAADWFPLLPYLGWFILGMVAGRRVYREKKSLLPNFPVHRWPVRALCACGRHSLLIYLIHQPVLYLILRLVMRS